MAVAQEQEFLSGNLMVDKKYFQTLFVNAMDLMVRDLEMGGKKACLLSVEGLINKQIVTLSILNPLLQATLPEAESEQLLDYLETVVLGAADQTRKHKMADLLDMLMSGFSVLLLDGAKEALVFGVQGFQMRGVQEPQNEVMQRGSKDGFTESFQINISMIRRRMKTPSLKFEKHITGSRSRTPVVICYLEGVASETVLQKVREKLSSCDLKTTLGAGYLSGFLEKPGIFSGTGLTERPDVVCGKIEEGRVAVLVDGTPSVLLVPFLFVENFQTMDDYLTRPFYATFVRWVRYLAFFISIFLPGLYVAITTHHPELLPESLLLKIAEAEAQTPFPVMLETLILYFMYEIMREAGLRAPRVLSTTVSIVGGLVIGETAVSAGLVSAPSLLVVALTAISGYASPRLYEPLALLRLGFLLVGNFLGVWGVMIGFVFLLLEVCGQDSFGVPMLSPVAPFSPRLSMRDVFARFGWKRLSKRESRVQDMPGSREIGQ